MRVRRSGLTTPGSSRKMMVKAAESDADEVILDLEDSVVPEAKPDARGKIVEAIHDLDWSDTVLAVRINDLETPYAYGDLIEVIEGAGEQLDVIVVPKVTTADDVSFVDTMLAQIEANKKIPDEIGIEVPIEEVEAVQNIDDIAASSDRLEALVFGPGDYSASQGVQLDSIGAHGDKGSYPGDIWHYVRNRIVVAARANDIDAIDGPYGDFSDPEGCREEAIRTKTLGFAGKWVIHPSQIDVVNDAFAPDEEKVERAQKVVDAMEQGVEAGKGAVQFEGEMLDEASVRAARTTLERARGIGMLD